MAECLVLGARCWNMLDKETKEPVQGCKIFYLDDVEGGYPGLNEKGVFPCNVLAPYEAFNDLKVLPGYYDLDFKQVPDREGKPQLKLRRMKYLAPAMICMDEVNDTDKVQDIKKSS